MPTERQERRQRRALRSHRDVATGGDRGAPRLDAARPRPRRRANDRPRRLNTRMEQTTIRRVSATRSTPAEPASSTTPTGAPADCSTPPPRQLATASIVLQLFVILRAMRLRLRSRIPRPQRIRQHPTSSWPYGITVRRASPDGDRQDRRVRLAPRSCHSCAHASDAHRA